MKDSQSEELSYKKLGKNYIDFAKKEPKLFKFLFMSESNLSPESFVSNDQLFEEIEKYVEIATKLKHPYIKEFHIEMWIFTYGLATLVATKTCKFTDREIDTLLAE